MAITHIYHEANKLDKRSYIIEAYDNIIAHSSRQMLFLSNEFTNNEINGIKDSRNIIFNNIPESICDEEHLKTLFEDKYIIAIDTTGINNKLFNVIVSVADTYPDKYFIFINQASKPDNRKLTSVN